MTTRLFLTTTDETRELLRAMSDRALEARYVATRQRANDTCGNDHNDLHAAADEMLEEITRRSEMREAAADRVIRDNS